MQKVDLPDWLSARLTAYTFWKVAVSVVADAFAAAVALLLLLVTVIITTTTTALCFLLIPPLLPLLSCHSSSTTRYADPGKWMLTTSALAVEERFFSPS